jgi:DNA-binding HxlR family transcriptional regulator
MIDFEELKFSGGTQTIYALATCGLLVKSSLPGAPDWKSKYVLTGNGKQVAEVIADGEGS